MIDTDVPGPSLLSSTMQHSSAKAHTPSRTPQPHPPSQPPKPNYDAFASLTNSRSASQSSTPAPSLLQQQQAILNQQATITASPLDPFASISLGNSRQGSPFTKPPPGKAPSTSMFDFASPTPQKATTPNPAQPSTQNTNGNSVDDDWSFSSALPEDSSLPNAINLIVSDKEVAIHFDVSRRKGNDPVLDILAKFSNKSAHAITEYTFQVAVTKVGQIMGSS